MPHVQPVSSPSAPRASAPGGRYREAPALEDVLGGRESLRRGMEGPAVTWLQQKLGLETDGKFGPATEQAVRAMQRQSGLAVDGVVGRQTAGRLQDGFRPGPTRPGQQPPSTPGSGTARPIRGFVDVDESRLRDALPPQAKHLAPAFLEAARKHDLDPRVLVAISKFETGNWTSAAFRNKNNAMGVSNSRGPIAFARAEESIERMARVLANPRGPYRNATTIGQVGAIYAPVGASNDPNGTNGYWPRSVARLTDELARELS
ncbi:MAG: peptidoglycan-binding protein [Myxococcaceae bacterium]|nr:peptidoglycan-binding protein [Myxococcaceae bacterium]